MREIFYSERLKAKHGPYLTRRVNEHFNRGRLCDEIYHSVGYNSENVHYRPYTINLCTPFELNLCLFAYVVKTSHQRELKKSTF